MLIRYLPGLDSSLQRVQGSLIATDIGEVAVEMRRDRETKALECMTYKEKKIPELLGSNFTYLLRLVQIAAHEDPHHVEGTREVLKASTSDDALEALGNTAWRLRIRAPIVVTPGMIKITLDLVF